MNAQMKAMSYVVQVNTLVYNSVIIYDMTKFNVIIIVYCYTTTALHHKQPSYLFNHLVPYTSLRILRSSDQSILTVPRVDSAIGRRAFSFAARTIWNDLPLSLRTSSTVSSFCSSLKTYLSSSPLALIFSSGLILLIYGLGLFFDFRFSSPSLPSSCLDDALEFLGSGEGASGTVFGQRNRRNVPID